MTTFDPEERAAIAERHRLVPASVWDIPPSGGADDYRCRTDGARICDAARLLDALDDAEAAHMRTLDALEAAEGRLLAAEAMAATVEHATNVVMPKLHAAEARIAALEQSLGELLYGVERLGIPEVDRARALLSEPRP